MAQGPGTGEDALGAPVLGAHKNLQQLGAVVQLCPCLQQKPATYSCPLDLARHWSKAVLTLIPRCLVALALWQQSGGGATEGATQWLSSTQRESAKPWPGVPSHITYLLLFLAGNRRHPLASCPAHHLLAIAQYGISPCPRPTS